MGNKKGRLACVFGMALAAGVGIAAMCVPSAYGDAMSPPELPALSSGVLIKLGDGDGSGGGAAPYAEPAGPGYAETFGPEYAETAGPVYEGDLGDLVWLVPGDASGTDAKVEAMAAEYPVAAQVYGRLAGEGWSDVCIAGTLGNMMTECGGQTLALDPYCDYVDRGVRYYGLCQWSMAYNGAVDGLDAGGQLDYLLGNVAGNMAYFGGSESTYASWLASTDAAQAARDFNRYYERGSGSDRRAANAAAAYEWILKF